jgi:hypothetical protein
MVKITKEKALALAIERAGGIVGLSAHLRVATNRVVMWRQRGYAPEPWTRLLRLYVRSQKTAPPNFGFEKET